MLCYVMLCYVMLCYVMLCYTNEKTCEALGRLCLVIAGFAYMARLVTSL